MSTITVKIEEFVVNELLPVVEDQQAEGTVVTFDMPLTQDEHTTDVVAFNDSDAPQADIAPSSTLQKVVQPVMDGTVPAKRTSLTISGNATSIVVPPITSSKSSKSKKKKTQPVVAMASTPTSQAGSQGAQGENTGRWTAEEHRLFLQGLEQHGKGWKKIASLIKSRTVVQIRTHAQKYFQKLAKARQNGEEGDVSMEGRVGATSVTAVAAAVAQKDKRRRQTTGTKRKAIQSVVGSAIRQGKKMATAQASAGVLNPKPSIPAVAPALAPFINAPCIPPGSSIPPLTAAQGAISGPALEDSLFRFLTPVPVASTEPQVNDVARQAGANPITLPTDNPSTAPSPEGGEISPTGVAEWFYPSWADAKDSPSWYTKGGDVDELLETADALDWFADTGDLHETYQPPVTSSVDHAPSIPDFDHDNLGLAQATSVNTLPNVDACVEDVVPPLPSLFDGSDSMHAIPKHLSVDMDHLDDGDEHLDVFDSPMEEHDFVSTLLESTGESSASLPALK